MELKSNKEEPGDARAAVEKILDMKKRGEKISALTAYDYPMARLLDEAGVDILLVGDSVGNVVLGFPDTTHVTMEHMLHHVAAVARAHPRGLLIADMPYRSYEEPEEAVRNARRLVEAGAQCLKIEGGRAVLPQVEAVLAAGIPVCGHLGMLPQQILLEGGYRIKGKAEAEQKVLLEDALALEKAGVMAIVLELVQKDFTPQITAALKIPTIGIGSGAACDGQVLVTHDLTGAFPWFTPRHVTPALQTGEDIRRTVREWIGSLKQP
ncbi:MAG: 3-methyl-2-oxobutanoate hydroxymethyltransferase [Limisphaerales bacterium]|jgi:3-methyl-2-oxobutanoate hydroxymethyltransferase|nr:3-methyl-2-oxobutanoate hydroxymethyltransferase [Verrucomicrobiota bacterium]